MQLNITGKHIEITKSLKGHLDTKFAKLEQHSDNINQVFIVLKVENVNHVAEATLHVDGDDFHASALEKKDMYAAIDRLIDKLVAQLQKHKEKMKKH